MRILDLIPEPIRERLELREGPHERPGAPRIVGIKPITECCGDCGDIVTGRIVDQVQFNTPFNYWRKQCRNCRRIENPNTGEWETMNHNRVLSVFRQEKLRRDK